MAVEIKKSVLTEQVEQGWKKQQLAEHYNIPVSQMTEVLKNCNLKIRKFHAPKYILVDDTENVEEKTDVEITVTDIQDTVVPVTESIEVVTETVVEKEEANW